MAWFRKRREPDRTAPHGPRPAVTIAPTMGDPAAATVLDATARGDWPAVRDFLSAVTDPDDHAFYVDIVSRVSGAGAWLARTVEAEPDSAPAHLLAGARAV